MKEILYKHSITEDITSYYFNKEASIPEMYFCCKYYSSNFKKAGFVPASYAVVIPVKIVKLMESSFIYNIHIETDIAHYLAPVDMFKKNRIKTDSFTSEYYYCDINLLKTFSKNIRSIDFDLDMLRMFKKMYKGYSMYSRVTEDFSGVSIEKTRKSFIKDYPSFFNRQKNLKEETLIKKLKEKEEKINPKPKYIQGNLF